MENVIRTAIEDVLKELGIAEVDFVVEHPAELSHGDYATNVAMAVFSSPVPENRQFMEDVTGREISREEHRGKFGVYLGGEMRNSPREVAEFFKEKLEGQIEYVEKIEVAGPGFINFFLARDFFIEEVARIGELGSDWGRNHDWEGQTVILEHTDPNPFKELHIGHLVPNALGESLARLFTASGADTKNVTFQGDVGLHVAKAIYGLQQMLAKEEILHDNFTAHDLGVAYATGSAAYETDETVQKEIQALNKKIYERSDEEVNKLYDLGKEVSLKYFKTVYTMLGSEFDRNFFESETGPVGLELVKAHIGDIFKESEGAVIFPGEEYGLHTRVFINKEGLPTYETKDVGLIKCKADWQPFDLAITVTGSEQTEYFKVTTKASELIQPELAGKVELVPNGMLRLSEGKMSSRTGKVVPALTLIRDVTAEAKKRMEEGGLVNDEAVAEDVAVGAIKYSILKIAAGKDIVFDLQRSVSFEGDSGPYLQYTNARINSVLAKAADAGIEGGISAAPEAPYEIEKILYRYPEVVSEATQERAPHLVVTYLTELAGAFNTFYAQERIADPDDPQSPYKVALTQAIGQTLQNGLWVLGIEAPERM